MILSTFSFVATAATPTPSLLYTFGPWIAILGIFYFLVFAPMRKQRKALQTMIDELKKGDKVVTTGGLHGEIAAVESQTVLLKIADNVKVRLTKSAIAGQAGDPRAGGTA